MSTNFHPRTVEVRLLGFDKVRNPGNRRDEPTADESLRLAMESRSPAAAGEIAQRALHTAAVKQGEEPVDPEEAVLLLREVFKAHIHAGRVRSAHAIARKMVRFNALSELSHADLGRSCAGLGWWLSSAQAFRLAARFAPARRRAMHWAACAGVLSEAGRFDEAVAALERAVRWSTTSTTRPLHRAHIALLRLEHGDNVDDIDNVMAELSAARCGQGFGRYILGRLMLLRGNRTEGARMIREFVKRNEADPMRAVTLHGDILHARKLLRGLRRKTVAGKAVAAQGSSQHSGKD